MSYDSEQSLDNPVADAPGEDAEADRQGQDEPGGQEGQAGSADPSKRFREMEVSEEEQREIAEERERRLDPANRPENSEVDNTDRTFDGEKFVD